MESDAESGILSRERDGFVKAFLIHHQAGRGQNPFAMGADDRLVDAVGAAKVVGVYN